MHLKDVIAFSLAGLANVLNDLPPDIETDAFLMPIFFQGAPRHAAA